MAKLKPAAFLSYVRFDDEHEDGRLSEFRKRLSGEVRMQTGEEFPIFQDRNDIRWGQNWQKRIDDSIDHSTFLVCILTPGFFKSPACKNEIERFVEREKKLGREDLILAVYYVECPQFRDKKQVEKDNLAKVVFSRQYVDWPELRFEPFTSAEAGRSLALIAKQIRDALHRPSGKSKDKRTISKAGRSRRSPKPETGVLATPISDALADFMKTTEVPAPKNEPVTRVVDATGRGQHTVISEAIAAASPGDRILIRPGVYREQLIIDKPLELVGDGKTEEIVLVDSNNNVANFQTTIGRIANLTIRHERTPKTDQGEVLSAVDISQGRLILENCHLFSAGSSVVRVRGGADPQITHNKIVSEGDGPGVLVAESRGLIENNEISVKRNFGVSILRSAVGTIVRQNRIRAQYAGVAVFGKATATVDSNEISGSFAGIDVSQDAEVTATRNQVFGCTIGIRLYEGARGRIEDNTIAKNKQNGIEVDSTADITIINNVLEENGAYGIAVSSDSSATLSGNKFLDNVAGESQIQESRPPKSKPLPNS